MKVKTFFEVLSAAHMTYHLTNVPSEFQDRGGIILIAPPGHLKSQIITKSLKPYPDVMNTSDLNTRTLTQMRDALVTGKYRTIAFPDFEKIYERNPDTAVNLEGHLKALVGQGFRLPSFDDQRMNGIRAARALMIGGIIPTIHASRFQRWINEGMTRRFIWCHYQLRNPDSILKAISEWKPIAFGALLVSIPVDPIPFEIGKQESVEIESMLNEHEGGVEAIQFILMKKIAAVLKWKEGQTNGRGKAQISKAALGILREFSESLRKEGADVDL